MSGPASHTSAVTAAPAPAFRPIRSGRNSTGLQPDVIALTTHRLGIAALLYSVIFVLGWGTSEAINAFTGGQEGWAALLVTLHPPELVQRTFDLRYIPHIVSGACIAAGLALFGLLRWRTLSPNRITWLSLDFMVFGSVGVSIVENWLLPPPYTLGVSWVCFWLCIYPMLVPLPPRRALIAALIAATTGPLCHILGSEVIGYERTVEAMAWRFFPNYVAALTAWIASTFIYRLSRDAARAHNMGSYRLIEPIGQGGMGEVWRAQHQLLARPAAVKLIKPETIASRDANTTSTLLKRFQREAQATAALRSNHTVEIYDYGLSDDGVFYYVMELLDGIDLETLVARHGPQPPERVANILLQACLSLEEAHQAGIIHRDIKPANVVLCRQGVERDFVKLLDFGLVKAMPTADQFATKLTADGMTYGTPAYMSPEIAQASSDLDHRSDIYSLGCVAYWLLTGEMVFERPNSMKILIAHVHDTPVPPSQLAPRPIPDELEALILSCLAKKPDDRPSSCMAMIDALHNLAVPWTHERATRWWQTLPASAASGPMASTADTVPAPAVDAQAR